MTDLSCYPGVKSAREAPQLLLEIRAYHNSEDALLRKGIIAVHHFMRLFIYRPTISTFNWEN